MVALFTALSFLSCAVYLRYKHVKVATWAWLTKEDGGIYSFFCSVGFCAWVYVLNLLPYILVARSAFIYHYMPALMYGEIMSALMVQQLVGKKRMSTVIKILLIIVISWFLFYSPWVYATPLTGEGHARRRLLKRWD